MGQGVRQQIRCHLLQSPQIAAHSPVNANVRNDFALRLGILKLLNDRRQTDIDIFNVRQFESDPTA